MRIEVKSKSAAKEFVCSEPWAAISVVSEDGEWPQISIENRVDLLQLSFHDRSNLLWKNHPDIGKKYFQDEQAEQVLDFVDKNWNDIECLMIHCEAGISRSSAIAASIKLMKEGRGADNHYFSQNTPYVPNMHVYSTILKVYHERGGEIDVSDVIDRVVDEPVFEGD